LAIDADALAGVLDQPPVKEWTGMTVRAGESPEWMHLFVSCSLPSGLIRMLSPQTAKGTVLTVDPYPSATAAAFQILLDQQVIPRSKSWRTLRT